MGGEVERVARAVVCDILKRPPPGEGSVPGNPWGAMPSDHISSAAITAMGLAEVSPLLLEGPLDFAITTLATAFPMTFPIATPRT